MRYLTVGRQVDAPAERVWSILVDTRRWPDWGPSVASAAVDGGDPAIGPDATGTVRTALGVRLPFRVTDWDEGRSWRWDVARLPATGHVVRELTPSRCEVVFEVPWFAAPYVAVCRVALDRIASAAVAG